jgi:hypothetical protein
MVCAPRNTAGDHSSQTSQLSFAPEHSSCISQRAAQRQQQHQISWNSSLYACRRPCQLGDSTAEKSLPSIVSAQLCRLTIRAWTALNSWLQQTAFAGAKHNALKQGCAHLRKKPDVLYGDAFVHTFLCIAAGGVLVGTHMACRQP